MKAAHRYNNDSYLRLLHKRILVISDKLHQTETQHCKTSQGSNRELTQAFHDEAIEHLNATAHR